MKPLGDHPFIRELSRTMGEVIKETTEKSGDGIVPARDYLPHEEYGKEVLLAALELETILRQLVQVSAFMSGFRLTQDLKANGISRLDHIIYHLENFLIRITGCFDRCLILVNVALDLGNEPEDCRYGLIQRNKHVARLGLLGPLGEINGIVKPYRESRNVVAHRQRHSEPELGTLELFNLMEKHDPDLFPEGLAKVKADLLVIDKKKEINGVNRKLQAAVGRLFSALKPAVERHYEFLKTAA